MIQTNKQYNNYTRIINTITRTDGEINDKYYSKTQIILNDLCAVGI